MLSKSSNIAIKVANVSNKDRPYIRKNRKLFIVPKVLTPNLFLQRLEVGMKGKLE